MLSDNDNGLKALFSRLDGAKGLVLTVGVHGPEGETEEPDSKLTVLDIGTIHEYGLGHNPERSFIRAWADENKTENEQSLKRIGEAVVKGTFSAEHGLNRTGLLFVGEIQERIVAGIAPPLDPRTIARKGSSTPLIHTGQLKSSIRHKVSR